MASVFQTFFKAMHLMLHSTFIPIANAFCVFTLVLALMPLVALAQTPEAKSNEPTSPILLSMTKIKALRLELVELDKQSDVAEGEKLESLLLQRQDKNKQLITELQELKLLTKSYLAGGGDLNRLLAPYKEEILNAGSILRGDVSHYKQQLDEDSANFDTLTMDGLKAYKVESAQLGTSIKLLHEYIGIVETMGFEASPSRNFIIEVLPERLETLAAEVRLSVARQEQIKNTMRIGETNTEGNNKLLLANDKLSFDTQSLHQTMGIAELYGVDVKNYHTLLVRSTGSFSTDMLDVDVISSLAKDWWTETKYKFRNDTPTYIFKIFEVLLIIFLFWMLALLVARLIHRSVNSKKLHVSVLMQNMLVSLSSRIIVVLGILVALSQLGISLGPLLAGFGVAGIVAGFALQDTLGNFAAGMMILFYRPYDVDDVVEAAGVFGTVRSMSIVSTTILTFDNQTLIIPNNKIWGDVIKNVTAQKTRRIDMVFNIGYKDDLVKAELLLNDIVLKHPKVLSYPEAVIRLHRLAESSLEFVVRPWTLTSDYWEVYWDITRKVKLGFDDAGINIPYPQQDVYVHQVPAKPEP